jgi:hypothetical protein
MFKIGEVKGASTASEVAGALLVCDHCPNDFYPSERQCGRVIVPFFDRSGENIEGTMICGECIAELGEFTGCRYRYRGSWGGYEVDALGQDEPPEYDWDHPRPSYRDVLEALCGPLDWERPSTDWPSAEWLDSAPSLEL